MARARPSFVVFVALVLAASVATSTAAGVSQSADTALADAARRGDVDAVRSLIAAGVSIDSALGDGMSAVHWAAANGSVEIAELLIEAGARLDGVTRIGDYTALHLASRAGHSDVAVTLLDAGADANAMTSTGAATSLHFAAASGSRATVDALLEHGAAIDARERQWGQTPLMFAAAGNRAAAIESLLAAGADASIAADVIDIGVRELADRESSRRRGQPQTTPPVTPATSGSNALPVTQGAVPPASQEASPAPATGVAPQEVLLGTTEIDPLSYADLVGSHGGLTALLLAARDGNAEAVAALLDGGADINQPSAGDGTPPMLMAAINGHFDLVLWLLAIMSMAIGMLISNFARNEGQVFPFIPLVVLSIILSGILIPVEKLPEWAQVFSYVTPLYYTNQVLQILIGGGALTLYLIVMIGRLAYHPQVAIGVYLAIGGGLVFVCGVALSMYRERLLQLPSRRADIGDGHRLCCWAPPIILSR